jgi:pimeloyl-ACP methyl ester carboxylesterase
MTASIDARGTLPPLWRELPHVAGWLARLSRGSAPPSGEADAPDVLLIPGFLSVDESLSELARALAGAGLRPAFAGTGRNAGCSEDTLARLAPRVEALARDRGGPIALVGHSRGGLFARVLAVRRPELVAKIVTLGSPLRDELAIHPALWLGARALGGLGRLGVTAEVRYRCGSAGCCDAFKRDLAAPVPPGIDFVSIFSRRDGVVDWKACLDPAARQVEVEVPHLALTTAPTAVAAVSAALRPLHERTDAPAAADRVRRGGRGERGARPARARAQLAGAAA